MSLPLWCLNGVQVRAPAVVLNEVVVVAAETLVDCLGCCPAEGDKKKKDKDKKKKEEDKKKETGRLINRTALPVLLDPAALARCPSPSRIG
jgi:hypothetical protein